MFLYAESRLLPKVDSGLDEKKSLVEETAAEYAKPGKEWQHGKYEIGKRMVVDDETTGGEEVAVREVLQMQPYAWATLLNKSIYRYFWMTKMEVLRRIYC